MLCFQAHQPTPSSSSPLAGESSFTMCCVSKLTSLVLPLPPLQQVSPCLQYVMFPSSPAHFSPLVSESSSVMWHVSKLTNPLTDGTHSAMAFFRYLPSSSSPLRVM